jgi:hypothetical protein
LLLERCRIASVLCHNVSLRGSGLALQILFFSVVHPRRDGLVKMLTMTEERQEGRRLCKVNILINSLFFVDTFYET